MQIERVGEIKMAKGWETYKERWGMRKKQINKLTHSQA